MITEADIAALRKQGDLKSYLVRQREQAHTDAAARRALVLRNPDVAARLCAPPLSYASPEQWNGFIPPATLSSGAINTTPVRTALLALVTEAEQATTRRHRPIGETA